jgi:hypothetical protein
MGAHLNAYTSVRPGTMIGLIFHQETN